MRHPKRKKGEREREREKKNNLKTGTKVIPPSVPASCTDESPLAGAPDIAMVMIITVIMKEGFIVFILWAMMCYYRRKREKLKNRK